MASRYIFLSDLSTNLIKFFGGHILLANFVHGPDGGVTSIVRRRWSFPGVVVCFDNEPSEKNMLYN